MEYIAIKRFGKWTILQSTRTKKFYGARWHDIPLTPGFKTIQELEQYIEEDEKRSKRIDKFLHGISKIISERG